MSTQLPTIELSGMRLAKARGQEVLDHVFEELSHGRGGWLITANLDFLRRFCRDPEMRALYEQADVTVADGMPLVWAARIQGDRLPERVTGSSMVWSLASRAGAEGRTLYLLGGDEGMGEAAAQEFTRRSPKLKISGVSAAMFSNPPTAQEILEVEQTLAADPPDILLVGLGSPKQEILIQALRKSLPGTWMIGVGISFSFVAGRVQRAPRWMQRSGLEWLHRLFQEPRRLARRYLIDDIPFSLVLFSRALAARFRRR